MKYYSRLAVIHFISTKDTEIFSYEINTWSRNAYPDITFRPIKNPCLKKIKFAPKSRDIFVRCRLFLPRERCRLGILGSRMSM